MVGPKKDPYKRSAPLAPQGILDRRFVKLTKQHSQSDLDFFRVYLPAHGVQFREYDEEALIAAIADKEYATSVVRHEANSVRSTRKIQRGVAVSLGIAFIDQEDKQYLREKANHLEVSRLPSFLHSSEYPRGSLYIIRDEQEEQCLYIGKASPG